jgi:hypothetical protein
LSEDFAKLLSPKVRLTHFFDFIFFASGGAYTMARWELEELERLVKWRLGLESPARISFRVPFGSQL